MGKDHVRILSLSLMLLVAFRLPAQDLRDPRFMERAQTGFDDIFNLDYDKANQVFASLEKEYPRHPAPPLYLASILWLEEMLRRQDLSLNRFVAPSYFSKKTHQLMPAQKRTAFFQALQRCETLASAILRKDRRDQDARYFLGMSCGLRSSFAITIDHSLREAFSYGNKSFSYCKQLVEENPSYYDAYLTVGIYEYIVGSIPWYLKWMVFLIGVRGDKQEGLVHLKLASENGQYVKNEAELVLMVLEVREHRYSESLEIAKHLDRRFPRNFIFALNVAQILQLAGAMDQAVPVFLDAEKRAEEGEPNFDKLPLETFRFNLGSDLMDMGKLDLAEAEFHKSIEDSRTPARERALSHLGLGQVLERKGQQSEALREYQTVLALQEVDDSHDRAMQLIKKLQRR
jgi:tetratricopeptide (TPR) repeat protein